MNEKQKKIIELEQKATYLNRQCVSMLARLGKLTAEIYDVKNERPDYPLVPAFKDVLESMVPTAKWISGAEPERQIAKMTVTERNECLYMLFDIVNHLTGAYHKLMKSKDLDWLRRENVSRY